MNEVNLVRELWRRGVFTDLYVLKPKQEKITLKLGVEEALCQTMEECSELSAASIIYSARQNLKISKFGRQNNN